MTGAEIAARAQSLVGARFRPQGRDPELGLDCVGTAAIAAGLPSERVPSFYALRGGRLAEIEHDLCDFGLQPVACDQAEVGDLILCEAGLAQFHLAVLTEAGFVHADAGLRMVVERPCPLPWRILSIWRAAAA